MNIKTPQELLEFMKNIKYGYLGKNGRVYKYDDPDFDKDWYDEYILESKDDLIKNLYGNCWDQVEFERDWFINNVYEVKTIFEMVKLDYKNDYPSHSFLAYKDKNGNWCWFENADFNNYGIHSFNSFDELIKYQYIKYLDYLKTFNITSEEIDKIIITEFLRPKDNISAKEYINHVMSSKTISFDAKELINNIDKLHTTEMGIIRIKKNLGLTKIDVVEYCKEKILDLKCNIYRNGKNRYCEIDNIVITVNAYSYTIITAHYIRNI